MDTAYARIPLKPQMPGLGETTDRESRERSLGGLCSSCMFPGLGAATPVSAKKARRHRGACLMRGPPAPARYPELPEQRCLGLRTSRVVHTEVSIEDEPAQRTPRRSLASLSSPRGFSIPNSLPSIGDSVDIRSASVGKLGGCRRFRIVLLSVSGSGVAELADGKISLDEGKLPFNEPRIHYQGQPNFDTWLLKICRGISR